LIGRFAAAERTAYRRCWNRKGKGASPGALFHSANLSANLFHAINDERQRMGTRTARR